MHLPLISALLSVLGASAVNTGRFVEAHARARRTGRQ